MSGEKHGRLCGRTGKIVYVELSSGASRTERPAPETYRALLGGRGLAGEILLAGAALDPHDPEAPLIFMTGPLTGTGTPGTDFACVAARSPLTGAVGDLSLGGDLGPALKRAGCDGLVLLGRAPRLSGLELRGGRIELTDASAAAGLETGAVFQSLAGRGMVAAVGPAAERGVLFAGLETSDGFSAARTGLGRVFAAKNLKYLLVEGDEKITVRDPAGWERAREDLMRLVFASPVLRGEYGFARRGDGALFDLTAARGMMPTANFRRTGFAAAAGMNAVAYEKKYASRPAGCRGCEVPCRKKTRDGFLLPNFETMSHFGPLVENDDLEAVVHAGVRCRELGLDPVAAAAVLACLAEITGERLSGERLLALLEEVGAGTGIGEELGQGSYRFAASRGRLETSMSVKKLDLPPFDPRGAYGAALSCAVSTCGGCLSRANPLAHELLRKPVATDRFSFAGKARIVKLAEDAAAAAASLVVCPYFLLACSLEEYARAVEAVTGEETTRGELRERGARIVLRERVMNAGNGFTAADDDLPARFFTEPGDNGEGLPVPPLDRREFLAARANYYKVRGLDGSGGPCCAD